MPSIAAKTSMQGKASSEVSRNPPLCHISMQTMPNSEVSNSTTAPFRRPMRTIHSTTPMAPRPISRGGRFHHWCAITSGMAVAQMAAQMAQVACLRRRSRSRRDALWPGGIGCSRETVTGSNLFDVVASISFARAEGSGQRCHRARRSSGRLPRLAS